MDERGDAESRLRAVIETVVDGIITIDAEGRIQSFNRAAERIFGYAAAEVVGQNVRVLTPEPHRTRHDGYLRSYLETGERKIIGVGRQVEGVRKDGSRFPLELAVSEMSVGGERMFTGIIRDVTERVAAEARLEDQRRELEATSRTDRIASRVLLAFGERTDETPADEILRVLAEEAGYRPLSFYLHDAWQGRLILQAQLGLGAAHRGRKVALGEGLVGEAAERMRPVFLGDEEPMALDTGVGWIEVATTFAIPLVHRDRLLGVLAGASQRPLAGRERSWLVQVGDQIAVGLHALRQLEELQELTAQLNDRARRIDRQNQELLRATRIKSEFLASVSHELRTPLNAIIGFSEVLHDGVVGPLQPAQLDYVSEIFSAGRHLLALINDILDLAKIEAGRMDLDLEEVDLAPMFGNALSIVKERAAEGGLALSSEVEPGLSAWRADGRKLKQIVYNLLSNAVKFTPSGGSVHLAARAQGDQLEVSVTDTGIGIRPEDQLRLFRPFEQLDAGIARKYEGTGLGLAMVRSLVELHAGTFGVDSAPGHGSRFWVRLPRPVEAATERAEAETDGPPVAPAVRVADAPRAARARRVLLVDHEPAASDALRVTLEEEGYDLTPVADVDAALAALLRARFDLVVLDLHAPGGDAFAALGRIASVSGARDVPVVVISADRATERAIALGAHAVFAKPVQREGLLATVRRLAPADPDRRPVLLVIDDDPKAIKVITSFFRDTPVDVDWAYGGREGLASVRARRPDLVVLDLMMPGMSGFEVLAALRADEATASLPVIVLTAKDLTADERATLTRDAQALLAKASGGRDAVTREARRLLGLEARRAQQGGSG